MPVYIYAIGPESPEAQRYAARLGARAERLADDNAAGYWGERPAGAALVRKLKCGDAVVCPRLSDIARDAGEALAIVEALRCGRIELHLLDVGIGNVAADKRFLATVKALAALRPMRSLKQEQRNKGRHLGGARPFGFQIGEEGKLIEDAREQAAIGKARAMHAAGKSLRTIQAALVADGHRVSHVTINRCLS
jgi:putative DNA-invertase from lambdoid prophage Rac